MELNKSTVFITGAASGMGQATAQYLSGQGAKLVLFDRDATALEAVAEALGAQSYAGDVCSEADVQAAIDSATANIGPISAAVLCAGVVSGKRIVGKSGPHPLDAFSDVIHVNLVGSFNCLRLLASHMSFQADKSVIIQTASIAAMEGQVGQAAYSASKGGVVALTLPAARELARFGVRVMTIAPGLMDTPMLQGLPDEVRERLSAEVVHPQRFGQASEYAKLAAHIIENDYLNGETIRLDAGLRMQP